MSKRNKVTTVCGVGRNDADYSVSICKAINGRPVTLWCCPIYGVWRAMLRRCYDQKYQQVQPTYSKCSVTPDWLSFMAFHAWMSEQDFENKQLDKDILVPGNKVYSPEFCVFVPARLNLFLVDRGAARGAWPIGVSWHKRLKKFQSSCQNPFTGKCESLGYFDNPEAAHQAWRARKHEHACTYADLQKDQRIAWALRNRYVEQMAA